VPHFIVQQAQRGRRSGQFQAAALFVDLTGFTSLTETLMQQGKPGAEALTGVLNAVFGPLVEAVYANGGWISTFAGDAFTALFPAAGRQARATRLALQQTAQTAAYIQAFLQMQGRQATPFGAFELAARVGLGVGAVQWGLLGGRPPRGAAQPAAGQVYFVRGPAVLTCAQAERLADPGEIVAAPGVLAQPGLRAALAEWGALAPLAEAGGAARWQPSPAFLAPPAAREAPAQPELSRADLQPFLPEPVLDLAAPAEFREAAVAFIVFEAPPERAALERLVGQAAEEVRRFGGYLNKLDFGDQGGVLLALFGAPVAHENDLARAADCLLALQGAGLPQPWRAGLTYGTVYAGFIGGATRGEYTAIGDVVNTAARLASQAEPGQLWLGPKAAGRLAAIYQLRPVGELALKGKQALLTVAALVGRKAPAGGLAEAGPNAPLVGREQELAQLQDFVVPLWRGRQAGWLTIYGEPGLGKSRLLEAFRQILPAQAARQGRQARWLLGVCDQTLRTSLNPFRYLLRAYFDQSPEASMVENRCRFTQRLADLESALADWEAEPVAAGVMEEVETFSSVLGALVGLSWPGSLYEQLEPRLRFENSLYAFKALIQAECLRQPVILALEDVHWLDDDSRRLLQVLSRLSPEYPLAVVCTSRYADDGGKPALGLAPEARQAEIDLNQLGASAVEAMAAEVLQRRGATPRPLAAELQQFLTEKTAGNPFFIEQLLLHLGERGLLAVQAGQWTLDAEQGVEVPSNINAVLIARLDRLSAEVRRVVQTAAVLGQEFEVQVLSQMLRDDPQVPARVQDAAREAIWAALSELRYIFRHVLLRDAAYEMQLRARLRELHRLAATAIETVYAADLAPHYADLAYHWDRAEAAEAAVHWYQLAGERAARAFANAEAIQYFSRGLALTPDDQAEQRWALLIRRIEVYDILGERAAQLQDLQALENLAAQAASAGGQGRQRWPLQACQQRANYAEAGCDYPATCQAATELVTLSQAAQDPLYEAEAYAWWVQGLIGRGDFEAALARVELGLQAAQAAQAAGEQRALRVQADLRLAQGNIASYRNTAGSARRYYLQALESFRELNSLQGQIAILNNLGLTYLDEADYLQAWTYYSQALTASQKIGDRRHECTVLHNLSLCSKLLGSYAEAEAYCQQALQVAHAVGEREVQALPLGILGMVRSAQGDQTAARQYIEQALDLMRQLGLKYYEGLGLDILGHILTELRDWAGAERAYRQALEIHQALGQASMSVESQAGLAHLAFLQSDPAGALACVEPVVKHLERYGQIAGSLEPFRAELICYRILRANADPRAAALLARAGKRLYAQADRLEGAARQAFLENVPAHRELVRVLRG
jgi:predicted ATPase/class 3 adenylate cyclase